MLENALWLVKFASNQNSSGSGIISFRDGCVFGGDSSYYYFGTYELNNDRVKAVVNIKQHSAGVSVFGNISEFNLELTGDIQSLVLKGHVKEQPIMTMSLSLQKLKDIPC